MNKPVNFELAKLLKEKGFDEKCKLLYKDGELINCKPYNVVDNKTFQSTRYYIAPIIAEALMWLYEKHGIWVEVNSPDYSKELWSFTIHKPYKFGSYGDGDGCNSPTEAYEAAIEYVLTKLL